MQLLLVQPPFVQLNAPYPAIAYLKAFCRGEGHEARCLDLSIELFRSIFSRAGLARVFSEAEAKLAGRESRFDPATRKNVLRYLSNAERYIHVIDRIIGLLSGSGDDALCHELAAGRRVPWGHRAEGFLEANDGDLGASDAPLLASLIVEDVADFITFSLDPEFSLVRYAESKASSQPDFRVVERAARESFLFEAFFRPLVAQSLREAARPDLICVTIPFPGTLPGALAFAEEARRHFGREMPVAFGGGYVSTELRTLREPAIFDCADFLCFDAGYGALSSVIDSLRGSGSGSGSDAGLYRTIVRRDGALEAHGFEGSDRAFFVAEASHVDPPGLPEIRAREELAIRQVFPDFSDLDLSRYVRIVEGTNPMHALWSGAVWLKARLAHGCYWRQCAFCDTALEYISRYAASSPEALFVHMAEQATLTGRRGVHFVDEAMPIAHLLRFGVENLRHGKPLSFWGNARLEKSFTPDACAVLAESGLVGVSFGLEIPTERGLVMTGKGLALPGIVTSLQALKTSGILVHAYLIYGWPGQTEQEIVDAMEVARQLFAEGLLDSAFWHRFILTRHSPMYARWRAGKSQGLRVIEPAWTFGSNDLSFHGEAGFERYGQALDASLGAWMEGSDLDQPAAAWFDFKVTRPSVAPDHIARLARSAARALRSPKDGRGKKVIWLGGKLLAEPEASGAHGARVSWAYRNELQHVDMDEPSAGALVGAVAASATLDELLSAMAAAGVARFEATPAYKKLRRFGLAAL
jgi:radical SAM superfamily enzyme YgiQ (UPF0313 family)